MERAATRRFDWRVGAALCAFCIAYMLLIVGVDLGRRSHHAGHAISAAEAAR